VKRQVFGKRYTLVFGIILIIANGYTFWPAFAYANTLIHCPAIFGILSYDVKGAAQVVAAPLYSEMQLVMHRGSTANETAIYRSDANNLTRLFQDFPTVGSVTQDLSQINRFDGSTNPVPANQAGVTITFENKAFEGIHLADLVYSIRVDASATDASYEIGGAPCWTGLVLTVGSLSYSGPLPFGRVQPIAAIINNVAALIVSTIACIALRFYWSRPKTKGVNINNNAATAQPLEPTESTFPRKRSTTSHH
jgi:hypothetical protein